MSLPIIFNVLVGTKYILPDDNFKKKSWLNDYRTVFSLKYKKQL